jgi:hypothetical protein
MREFSDFKAVQALAPALRTASATGGSIDRWGFGSLSFLVSAGAWTDGTHTVSADHSNDGSTWEAIPAEELTTAFPVVDAGGDASQAYVVGYIGDRRYVRGKSAVSGSPVTGAIVGITVLLGRPHSAPVA